MKRFLQIFCVILVLIIPLVSIGAVWTGIAWLPGHGVAGRVPFVYNQTYLTDEAELTYNSGTNTLSTDNLDAPTGRTATHVVAFANSTNKSQADIVLKATSATDSANITLDTAALNALVTATSSGGKIEFLDGSGWVNSPILYSDSITFEGLNWSASGIRLANGANCAIFQRTGATNSTNFFVCWRNLYLNGNYANNTTTGYGIYASDYIHDVIVENCFIEDFKDDAIYAKSVWNVAIDKCIIEWCRGVGVENDGGQDLRITSSKFLYISGNGIDSLGSSIKIDNCFFYNLTSLTKGYDIRIPWGVDIQITGNTFWGDASADYTGQIRIQGTQGQTIITGNNFYGANRASYAVYDVTANISNLPDVICNNQFYGYKTTTPVYINSTVKKNTIVQANQGYVAPGEIRILSGTLTAGVADAIAFSHQNPYPQDAYVDRVVIEVTTTGGTATSVLQVGIADDATGTNIGAEFFPAAGCDLNATAVYESRYATDTGVQVKPVTIQDSVSATDSWVVGKIKTANASSLVGKYYVFLVGK